MSAPHPNLTLFPRGLSAGARLLIYVLISIAVITADTRFHGLDRFRAGINTLLYPLQTLIQTPGRTYDRVSGFFVKQARLERENTALRQNFIQYSIAMQRYRDLEQENQRLRTLLGAQQRTPLHTQLAEILAIPRDPYQFQVTVNRGSQQGIKGGEAVVDETGLLGQVTRVYPFSSEITLLTNKDQSVPVIIQRTGQRAIMFGMGIDDSVEIRYLPHNTDVRTGDLLVTSGIDGVYPSGLAVAKVTQIDLSGSRAFAHIECKPLAAVDRNRQVLIVDAAIPAPAAPAATAKPLAPKPPAPAGKH
ncbi:rod shape-determining protein MreC [Sulfuriferula sp. AH1]|uniref:rod shape-determining protein MreC n=1 Tax=Sulfuriferula sp. AH1 TaxID=1985873 RepID=UPI000B3B63AC|nr:rod shape-determining protein MreC [Sulfuriferula sp. AH1]ARU32405.1 rod shape-determining protein MreC [Sulfuriferula sp. AH1]